MSFPSSLVTILFVSWYIHNLVIIMNTTDNNRLTAEEDALCLNLKSIFKTVIYVTIISHIRKHGSFNPITQSDRLPRP